MGIIMSKVDGLKRFGLYLSKKKNKYVSLCKERKDLIKAAVDCRYELVSAHTMYFESLSEMGNAIHRFVEEDLDIIDDSSSDSSDENLHLEISSESDSESLSNCDVHDHMLFSGGSSEFSLSEEDFQAKAKTSVPMWNNSNQTSTSAHMSNRYSNREDESFVPIVDMRYSIPTDATMDNFRNNATDAPYVNSESARVPVDFPPRNDFWFPHNYSNSPGKESAPTPIPSVAPLTDPEPASSAWEYLNPFKIASDNFYDLYKKLFQGNVQEKAESEDSYIRKIREMEGIPDLEDDTEHDLVRKRRSRENKDTSADSSGSTTNDYHEQLAPEKEYFKDRTDTVEEIDMECSSSFGLIKVERGDTTEESATSEDDEEFSCDECSEMSIHCAMNLQQAVKEIKNAFDASFIYGKEVAILLEAGKLPYQTTSVKVKALASGIANMVVSSFVMPLQRPVYMLSSRSASKKIKSAKVVSEDYEDLHRQIIHLSSTLEKLYLCEKKLFEEVKGYEMLRVDYDKEDRRLKDLDDRGAEFSQIDEKRASIKRLRPKIIVSFSEIVKISLWLHNVTDEELQSEVIELIEGFSRMWKFIIECHKKQFKAITEAKIRVHIASKKIEKGSHLIATLKLEKETLKWAARFSHYIRTQKAFVSFLNNWLLMHLSGELETPVEVNALSPNRVGAPAVFAVCNEWYNAVMNISEDAVYRAILGFASSLHHLLEKRREERRQRRKLKQLLKDSEYQYEVSAELDEQTRIHQESIKQLNDAAFNSVSTGLPPIFETLRSFCVENSKAYERIRIPQK